MNVLTKIRLLNDLNERELRLGIAGTKASWHEQYRESAWIYAGSLPYELSEGDVICVFSQYGEIVNINLIRDWKTGKSKGLAFVCYQDQRSTILAVDNLNGSKIKGRQIRVDHASNYKPPKDDDDIDELTKHIREEGVAPKPPMAQQTSTHRRRRVSSEKETKPQIKHKKRTKEHKELKLLSASKSEIMTTLSKEEYLKRYLDPVKSGDYKKEKKKTKDKAKQVRGMKIVDDDSSSDTNVNRYESSKKRKSLKHSEHSKPAKRSRRTSSDSDKNASGRRRQDSSDSDLEVPRYRRLLATHKDSSCSTRQRLDSDSDLELPRQNKKSDSKMSSGGVGGLTSRQQLKKELAEKRKTESNMDSLAKASQKEATVFREKGGKKRDLEKEKLQKDADDKEKEKKAENYNQWGKGLTQVEMKDYALEDLIHEANKPLARYADDADLDAFQRSQMRDGDPMAEYLAKKRSKETGNTPSMPKYRGPAPAPNRYGIPPGYRWDGVDRSNGFEKKYFHSKSESGALKQEAYKWSVEDM